MKRLYIFFTSSALSFIFPLIVHAQVRIPNPIKLQTFEQIFPAILAYIAGIAASLAVIVFLWAGILFLTSGVYQENLAKARTALFWGVVGLAITLSAGGLFVAIKAILGIQ